jgi:hypothetical protein
MKGFLFEFYLVTICHQVAYNFNCRQIVDSSVPTLQFPDIHGQSLLKTQPPKPPKHTQPPQPFSSHECTNEALRESKSVHPWQMNNLQ